MAFKIAFQSLGKAQDHVDKHTACVKQILHDSKWRHTPDIGKHGTKRIELTLAYLPAGGTLDATDNIRFNKVDFD